MREFMVMFQGNEYGIRCSLGMVFHVKRSLANLDASVLSCLGSALASIYRVTKCVAA